MPLSVRGELLAGWLHLGSAGARAGRYLLIILCVVGWLRTALLHIPRWCFRAATGSSLCGRASHSVYNLLRLLSGVSYWGNAAGTGWQRDYIVHAAPPSFLKRVAS